MTLVEFLLAMFDKDEAVARAAADGGPEWEYATTDWGAAQVQTVATHGVPGHEDHYAITRDSEGLSDSVEEEAGRHIARHDPARVLRDVKAKRRIVNRARGWLDEDPDGTSVDVIARDLLGHVLRNLAASYADDPDYREEWAS